MCTVTALVTGLQVSSVDIRELLLHLCALHHILVVSLRHINSAIIW